MHLPTDLQTYLDMFVGTLVSNSRDKKEAKERLNKELDRRFNYIIKSKGIEDGSYTMNQLKTFALPYIKEYANRYINRVMVA